MGDDVAYRRRAGVLHRDLTDGTLVLAPTAEAATALLGTAADLWELLATPSTVDAIVAALTARYAGPTATVTADVRAALDELDRAGLVERVPARAAR